MRVEFRAAGSAAWSASTTPVSITAPACNVDDILIAVILNKELSTATGSPVISAPDGTWTEIYQADSDCTTAGDDFRCAVFWKRATASGGSFSFSKNADNNVLFGGAIIAYGGCKKRGSPIDATAVGSTLTAAAGDTATFPAFDPTSLNNETVFVCFAGNDATTFAAAMSADTNPDCTIRLDVETNAGTDCSIGVTSGNNDGSNIASRTWDYAASTNCGNRTVVFALVAESRKLIVHT